jgi:uncharacterized protein (TIGR00251 family)
MPPLRNKWIAETPHGVLLIVKVFPNAPKSVIGELRDECLCVKVAAPPVIGKANKECLKLLADFFNLRKAQVSIRHGETNKIKEIVIEGMSKEDIIERLRG